MALNMGECQHDRTRIYGFKNGRLRVWCQDCEQEIEYDGNGGDGNDD
jgi:hypothetical protein